MIANGNNINKKKKYKKDNNLPTVKYGSITGIPPIQHNKQQLNKNIQKNILCAGLNTPLRTIAFFII
jgi:hypothetical protein